MVAALRRQRPDDGGRDAPQPHAVGSGGAVRQGDLEGVALAARSGEAGGRRSAVQEFRSDEVCGSCQGLAELALAAANKALARDLPNGKLGRRRGMLFHTCGRSLVAADSC